jgi:uncharacterized membrane protein
MRTPASIKGHPIHAMLVPLPIGLWIFALVGDVAVHAGGGNAWRTVAFYCLGGGIVGALLAAIAGLIDLLSLPPGRTRTVAVWHMCLNLAAVAVFALNFGMRLQTDDHSGRMLLTLAGIVIIGASGWLGGKLVYEAGVGVVATEGERPRTA